MRNGADERGLCENCRGTQSAADRWESGGRRYLIRKAEHADIPGVEQLYSDVLEKQEREVNYTNWKRDVYPTGDDARKALEEGTLYVAVTEGLAAAQNQRPQVGGEVRDAAEDGPEGEPRSLVGAVILNHAQPEEYGGLDWSVEAEPGEVLVIHTLCISPHCRKSGLGRRFVAFAEELALASGCRTIRLDTYEGNAPAAALYTKLGYTLVGNAQFHFQKLIWETLICFDKAIQ